MKNWYEPAWVYELLEIETNWVAESMDATTLWEAETQLNVYITGPQYVLMFCAKVNPAVN